MYKQNNSKDELKTVLALDVYNDCESELHYVQPVDNEYKYMYTHVAAGGG